MNRIKEIQMKPLPALVLSLGLGALCFAFGPQEEKPALAPPAATQAGPNKALLHNPKDPQINQTAPEVFKARFETSKGTYIVQVTRKWAPHGADRFFNLVKNGFYDDVRYFRVISGFMVQSGISGDPAVNQKWQPARIEDDPVTQSNTRGRITFATSGPNSRTTQVFISFGDNAFLDTKGFSPFGEVVEGMEVVDKLYAEYGEGAPRGKGPDQGRMQKEGNAYLEKDFPMLDYVKTASIVEDAKKEP